MSMLNRENIKEIMRAIETKLHNEFHKQEHENSYAIGHSFKVIFTTEKGTFSTYFQVRKKELRDEMHYYLYHPELSKGNKPNVYILNDIFFVEISDKSILRVLKVQNG